MRTRKPPKEKKFYECDLCKVRCDTPDQLNIHQSSKKHMKRVKAAEAAKDAPPEDPNLKKKIIPQKRQKFHCELCGVWCDTDTILQIHLKSKKHMKKMKQLPPVGHGGFSCKICNVSCSSQAHLDSHIRSKKHQRNVFQIEQSKLPEQPPKEKQAAKAVASPTALAEPTCIPVPTAKEEPVEGDGKEKESEGAETSPEKEEGEPSPQALEKLMEKKKCELCRIICQNLDAYNFHIATNRHKKREAAMKMQFKCEVCCVGTNTQLMLNKHLESKNHKLQQERFSKSKWGFQKSPHAKKTEGANPVGKRKKKNRRKKKKAEDGSAEGVESATADQCPFVCKICDVRCNTQEVLDIHLNSKKHFRKLKFQKDQKEQLFCQPCAFQADSKGNFDEHLRSQKHADAAGISYSSTGKRKADFGDEPRKKAKLEEEWKCCRICGSVAHKFQNCPIMTNRSWTIDPIERSQLKKCTTIANDRHRDLVVLFTVKDKQGKRLVSHFICCSAEVQQKMLNQVAKLMNDMLPFAPETQWYEIDYRFGNWLHKPTKSSPHLHIFLPEEQFFTFLRAQPADSPIWPKGLSNFEEFSLTQPVEKNYGLDRVYATKRQMWRDQFTMVENFLAETKGGLEVLLQNGICDGSAGVRVGRPGDEQHYQFFIRVSAEGFLGFDEEKEATLQTSMAEKGFEFCTGVEWNENARAIEKK